MPINPSIAMRYQPPQIESPLNAMAKMIQLRQAEQVRIGCGGGEQLDPISGVVFLDHRPIARRPPIATEAKDGTVNADDEVVIRPRCIGPVVEARTRAEYRGVHLL